MGHPPQTQLGLHQGKARSGLQETLGVLAIQLGFEDHLSQGRLQFNQLNLADIDTAIADRAANPEPRITLCHQ